MQKTDANQAVLIPMFCMFPLYIHFQSGLWDLSRHWWHRIFCMQPCSDEKVLFENWLRKWQSCCLSAVNTDFSGLYYHYVTKWGKCVFSQFFKAIVQHFLGKLSYDHNPSSQWVHSLQLSLAAVLSAGAFWSSWIVCLMSFKGGRPEPFNSTLVVSFNDWR